MRSVGFHRQRQRRQRRLHEREIVVAETVRAIGREGIDNPRSLRPVAAAESVDKSDIVRRSESEELLEDGKVALFGAPFDSTAHDRVLLAGVRALDELVEGTAEEVRAFSAAVGVLLGSDGVEIAPPGVAVAAPLRMQSLHRGMRAPERGSVNDQPLAIAVEQFVGRRAAQAFAHRPDVRIDDALAERVVEGGKAELLAQVGRILHERQSARAALYFSSRAIIASQASLSSSCARSPKRF